MSKKTMSGDDMDRAQAMVHELREKLSSLIMGALAIDPKADANREFALRMSVVLHELVAISAKTIVAGALSNPVRALDLTTMFCDAVRSQALDIATETEGTFEKIREGLNEVEKTGDLDKLAEMIGVPIEVVAEVLKRDNSS